MTNQDGVKSTAEDQFESLLKQSLTGKRDWRLLARLILACEKSELWKGQTNSFSAWLKQYAEQLGIQITNLWRYRRAANAAFVFWGDMGLREVDDLMDIPKGISPESIEILEKISRAAPAYLVKDLAARLLKKELPISELRSLWRQFRPVLDGKNARGRGKLVPALSRKSTQRKASLLEDLAIESLRRLRAKDIGGGGTSQIKILRNVMVKAGHFELDAVMVVSGGKGGVEIHGVEILGQIYPAKIQFLQLLRNYCDYVWAAFPSDATLEISHDLDADIGLIQVRELNAVILRNAKKNSAEHADKTARSIINKLME